MRWVLEAGWSVDGEGGGGCHNWEVIIQLAESQNCEDTVIMKLFQCLCQ